MELYRFLLLCNTFICVSKGHVCAARGESVLYTICRRELLSGPVYVCTATGVRGNSVCGTTETCRHVYTHVLEYMCVWLVIVLNVSCRIMNSWNVSYGFTGVYSLDRSAAHAPHKCLTTSCCPLRRTYFWRKLLKKGALLPLAVLLAVLFGVKSSLCLASHLSAAVEGLRGCLN